MPRDIYTVFWKRKRFKDHLSSSFIDYNWVLKKQSIHHRLYITIFIFFFFHVSFFYQGIFFLQLSNLINRCLELLYSKLKFQYFLKVGKNQKKISEMKNIVALTRIRTWDISVINAVNERFRVRIPPGATFFSLNSTNVKKYGTIQIPQMKNTVALTRIRTRDFQLLMQ